MGVLCNKAVLKSFEKKGVNRKNLHVKFASCVQRKALSSNRSANVSVSVKWVEVVVRS